MNVSIFANNSTFKCSYCKIKCLSPCKNIPEKPQCNFILTANRFVHWGSEYWALRLTCNNIPEILRCHFVLSPVAWSTWWRSEYWATNYHIYLAQNK